MFEIIYSTYSGVKKTVTAIEEDYILTMFNLLLNAEDLASADLIDGFTGKVLLSWHNGKFTYIHGLSA